MKINHHSRSLKKKQREKTERRDRGKIQRRRSIIIQGHGIRNKVKRQRVETERKYREVDLSSLKAIE